MNTLIKTRKGYLSKHRSDAKVRQHARRIRPRRQRQVKIWLCPYTGHVLHIEGAVATSAFVLYDFTAPGPNVFLQTPALPLRSDSNISQGCAREVRS